MLVADKNDDGEGDDEWDDGDDDADVGDDDGDAEGDDEGGWWWCHGWGIILLTLPRATLILPN